jgi:hypothetical protein
VKVQIVYLSAADDVDSTRDMLAWVQAPRVLLVWPDKGHVLKERLELVKISRYAMRRNIQIGILTFDRDVRHIAKELDLPIFDSLDELPEEGWANAHPQGLKQAQERLDRLVEPTLESPRERIPSWAEQMGRKQKLFPRVVLIGLTTILVLFLLPSAEVVLAPELEDHQMLIMIAYDGEEDLVDDSMWVPSGRMELEISEVGSKKTTGWTKVPSELAQGSVIFTNHTQDPVRIPFNTILHAGELERIRFRTLNTVVLPRGVGSQVEVLVEALDNGAAANIPPSTISAIEGPLGLLVSVENEKATFGGVDELQPSVSEDDLKELQGELLQNLFKKAKQEAILRMGENQVIFDAGIWISEIIDQESNHDPGEVGEVLEIRIVARIAMAIFDLPELEDLISDHLSSNFPEGVELTPGSLVLSTEAQDSSLPDDSGKIELSVHYQTFGSIDSSSLIRKIVGRPIDRVSSIILGAFPTLEAATVKSSPRWIPFVPLWGERISTQMEWE